MTLFFLFYSLNATGIIDPHSMSIHTIEKKFSIPHGLLSAISKVESGRYHEKHKRIISWPWVIHSQGKGHFFGNKEEAIKAVQRLKDAGVTNIDVGLMQVNLYYHGKAFTDLDHAFDPKANIEYAAKFLTTLKKEHGSWSKAVAHYHSACPDHHIPYRQKVYKMWQEEQKNSFRSWSDLSARCSEESEEKTLFRSPQFRVIRLRPSAKANFKMPVVKTSLANRMPETAKKPPMRLRKISTRSGSNINQLQNRFRFIKTRKAAS